MHISKNNIEIFEQKKTINTEEMITFLEHLDQCDFCLEQMIEEEERNSRETAPAYLSEEILKKAASPETQAAQMIRSVPRRLQFFYYGLRTAAGVAAALVLLFFAGHVDFSSVYSFPSAQTAEFSSGQTAPRQDSGLGRFSRAVGSGISKGSDKVADYLGSFSNKIIRGGE